MDCKFSSSISWNMPADFSHKRTKLQSLAIMGRFGLAAAARYARRPAPALPGVASRPATASRLSMPAVQKRVVAPKAKKVEAKKAKKADAKKADARRPSLSATSKPTYHHVMPTVALQKLLDSWGPALVKQVIDCYDAWVARGRDVGTSSNALKVGTELRVGTDCSGAEAPIWALREMGIKHIHKVSCDWKKSVRDFILAVSPPSGPVFHDMLTRKMADIPDVDLYVCGFPCTPFSSLRRHRTRLLQEAAAKPFKKLLKVLEERKPALAVLENVLGIAKVMNIVCRMLAKLGCYFVIVVKLDSQDLGVPIARPRYYFILVRKNAAITQNVDSLASLGKAIVKACKLPVQGTVLDLMLPKAGTSNTAAVGMSGGKPQCKWPAKHTAFRQKFALSPPTSCKDSDALGLRTMRHREAWQLLVNAHPGKMIIADLSQNIDRCRVSTNGVCPTLTPKSILCVQAASREVSPMDTLALHFFPVHRMKIPTTVTPTTLRSLGGNTMHLKSVGLAICMGMAMVKPSFGQEVTIDKKKSWGVGMSKGMADVVFLDSFDEGSGSRASTKRRVRSDSRHAQGRLKRQRLLLFGRAKQQTK